MHLSLGGPQSEWPPGHGCSLHWPPPWRASFPGLNSWQEIVGAEESHHRGESSTREVEEQGDPLEVPAWEKQEKNDKDHPEEHSSFSSSSDRKQKQPGPMAEILSLKVQVYPR